MKKFEQSKVEIIILQINDTITYSPVKQDDNDTKYVPIGGWN